MILNYTHDQAIVKEAGVIWSERGERANIKLAVVGGRAERNAKRLAFDVEDIKRIFRP